MRYIILLTLFSLRLFAQPSYLKDAKITVTLKNGKSYTFSANSHKIVDRVNKTVAKRIKSRHSLGLLGGTSKSKLDTSVNNTTVKSETIQEPVFGLNYRITKDNYFTEFVILSNKTFLMGVGKEF